MQSRELQQKRGTLEAAFAIETKDRNCGLAHGLEMGILGHPLKAVIVAGSDNNVKVGGKVGRQVHPAGAIGRMHLGAPLEVIAQFPVRCTLYAVSGNWPKNGRPRKVCAVINTKHVQSQPHTPQANSQVERLQWHTSANDTCIYNRI